MKRSVYFLLSFLCITLIISCQKEASFETNQPTGPSSSGTAIFTFQGSGSNCMNSSVAGVYAKGTALTNANNVTLEVNVATAGTWKINTGSVTGFFYAGSGTFTTTGVQTITLNGSGTPGAIGNQTFSVVVGSGTCTFNVPVTATSTNPNPASDHFPLTANSWWSYDEVSAPGDSIKRTNIGARTFNNNTYRIFEDRDNTGILDSVYYRKNGSDYLEYAYVDDYSLISFDNAVFGDILFLKEGTTTGATWYSAEFSGMVSGQIVKLRYHYTVTNANATVTVNGKTFSNVYQVTYNSQISSMGSPFIDEGLTWIAYYAQGIGMIYTKATAGTDTFEINIRNYKIF